MSQSLGLVATQSRTSLLPSVVHCLHVVAASVHPDSSSRLLVSNQLLAAFPAGANLDGPRLGGDAQCNITTFNVSFLLPIPKDDIFSRACLPRAHCYLRFSPQPGLRGVDYRSIDHRVKTDCPIVRNLCVNCPPLPPQTSLPRTKPGVLWPSWRDGLRPIRGITRSKPREGSAGASMEEWNISKEIVVSHSQGSGLANL